MLVVSEVIRSVIASSNPKRKSAETIAQEIVPPFIRAQEEVTPVVHDDQQRVLSRSNNQHQEGMSRPWRNGHNCQGRANHQPVQPDRAEARPHTSLREFRWPSQTPELRNNFFIAAAVIDLTRRAHAKLFGTAFSIVSEVTENSQLG
jgi:hypothetical protein